MNISSSSSKEKKDKKDKSTSKIKPTNRLMKKQEIEWKVSDHTTLFQEVGTLLASSSAMFSQRLLNLLKKQKQTSPFLLVHYSDAR